MNPLISLHQIEKSFGSRKLFAGLSLHIKKGERVGLIGENGAGKSTLLKIIAGLEKEDGGSIAKSKGLNIAYAGQFPHFSSMSVLDVVTHELLAGGSTQPEECFVQAQILLGKAGVEDSSVRADLLSGGWKKRVDIIRAMMHKPDLLLLDEPTNHLDIESILWLETFLLREAPTFIVISHDRYFLKNVANRFVEINRRLPEGLFTFDGSYDGFIEHTQQLLVAQEKLKQGLSSKLRREEEWLRRSPKARTTKSQARVDQALELAADVEELKRKSEQRKVDLQFLSSERQTRKLISINNISKTHGGKLLFKGLDLQLCCGMRLGILGKNGTGKTTLLKILAGLEKQDQGTVKRADDLRVVYFDQLRERVDLKATLRQALCPDSDFVEVGGRQLHVNSWAKRFLFEPDRLTLPVSELSGGERARILIARLMTEPADLLFLDEPTNDLDIPTLEVMEEGLAQFTGAVVLITHDRCLMDRVCDKLLGLTGEGGHCFVNSYSQWEKMQKEQQLLKNEELAKTKEVKLPPKENKRPLSYKEKQELEAMEVKILELEEAMEKAHQTLEQAKSHEEQMKIYELLAVKQQQLEAIYRRWQELEDKLI